ncbi:MAG: ASKHA domain-containing protein [Pirellulales bacterium]|nr:ASKHA domain-containing protein [Pirellulales bacterium]
MKKIDREAYEKSLEKLGKIYSQMAEHAEKQARYRCPYKNVRNECTAKFGCRYQNHSDGIILCTSDDKLDYRSAWEIDPDGYQNMRKQLQAESDSGAVVSHSGNATPLCVGNTLFDHADELAVRVPTSCGRTGHCHECIVEVRRGHEGLSPRTEDEAFLAENYRLACQATILENAADIEFALLRRSPQILTSIKSTLDGIDPMVTRQGDQVMYGDESIDSYRGKILGLSMDLGTTTVVVELVDLESGQQICSTAFENPQRFGGSDIMNRISYDSGPFAGELHRSIINTLNTEIQLMCAESGYDWRTIYELVVVGNTTMRELFFNLDVQSVGQKPYKSDIENEYLAGKRSSTALTKSTRSLRIRANKNARVFGAPLIASHVGGDIVADLVAIDMPASNKTVMLVDAGTNTEVILRHQGQLLAASCPAGPAFEGGLVQFGMPGCQGAIESFRYGNSGFEYDTIGTSDPQGICGSGLIDLLAELRRHDLMTPMGVFADKKNELSVVPEHGITFSREDASHLAQAKAANYCGQILLMRKLGISPNDIDQLYLAGGFANYVDSASAAEIGFIAPVPPDRIKKVGNAAAEGARRMLLSRQKREAIAALIQTIQHVELETMPDFFDVFVDGCQFRPMILPDAT